MKGFTVNYRNPGHWDIVQDGSRIYRIRGGPSAYLVFKEVRGAKTHTFKTLPIAMAFICDELMFEVIMVDGQPYKTIESYHI